MQLNVANDHDQHWLPFARAGWVVLTLLILGLTLASIPIEYHYLITPCQECAPPALSLSMQADLAHLGLSIQTYATIMMAEEKIFFLLWIAVATVVFLRRPGGRMETLLALMLSLFGYGFVAPTDALAASGSAWLPVVNGLITMGVLLIVLFFFVFPDGQFVPGWTWYVFLIFIIWNVVWAPVRGLFKSPLQYLPYYFFPGLAAISQIIRYRQNRDPIQRQQTKWVVYGVSVSMTTFIIFLIIYNLAPVGFFQSVTSELFINPFIYVVMTFIPASIVIAILRHRLWDIDIVIRKTLVYATLTVGLALVFFGCVVASQGLFVAVTGQNNTEVGNVFSTLVMAALFTPLRRRIQYVIDRRFYRQKYNAERALANLQQTLQDAVELDLLQEKVLVTIDQTLNPDKASIWLMPPDSQTAGASQLEGMS